MIHTHTHVHTHTHTLAHTHTHTHTHTHIHKTTYLVGPDVIWHETTLGRLDVAKGKGITVNHKSALDGSLWMGATSQEAQPRVSKGRKQGGNGAMSLPTAHTPTNNSMPLHSNPLYHTFEMGT